MSAAADPDAEAARLAELSERLIELEVRLAYQDRTVAALDDVVRALAARIDQLEKELETLRAAADQDEIGPQSERPPHY